MSDKRDSLFAGELDEISLSDFRAAPGDVIAQAQMGKVFVLTKQGKAVAVLSKPPGANLTMSFDSDGKVSYVL